MDYKKPLSGRDMTFLCMIAGILTLEGITEQEIKAWFRKFKDSCNPSPTAIVIAQTMMDLECGQCAGKNLRYKSTAEELLRRIKKLRETTETFGWKKRRCGKCGR